MKLLAALTVSVGLFGPVAAHAAALFDFEKADVTDSFGGYSVLTQTSGGLTATFTRPGSVFDIDDTTLGGDGPKSFGTHSLSPFYDADTNTPFVVSFSTGLKSLSFEAGDFGSDSDTVSLSIFSGANGTGTLLKTVSVFYGTGSFPDDIATLSATSATPFLSAAFIGGSTEFPNSVFYDNFSASTSAVPLPSALPMFAAALFGIGLWGAKSRRGAAKA